MSEPVRQHSDAEVVGFVGVGLDNEDGHKRLTQGENFVLVGGSGQTHERMIDTAVYVNEALRKQGKSLEDASAQEIKDLFDEAQGSQ